MVPTSEDLDGVGEGRAVAQLMPYQPARPCRQPGCPELTLRGYCDGHRRERERRRGNAAQRGYGHRWRKYRRSFLAANPLCVHCEQEGRVTAATDVDHIKAVRGKDDPLFWEPSNIQGLCGACHRKKTIQEDGALVA